MSKDAAHVMISIPSGESWVERAFVEKTPEQERVFKENALGTFDAIPCDDECDCYSCKGFGPVRVERGARMLMSRPARQAGKTIARQIIDAAGIVHRGLVCGCPDVCMCHVKNAEVDQLPGYRRLFE